MNKNVSEYDPSVVEYTTQKLTVQQLLELLQQLVKEDPAVKDAVVHHVEFGSMTSSHCVTVQQNSAGETELILSE